LIAGWSSNNKYSLIGAMRSGAQILSYELSVSLSLVTIIILAGSMQLSVVVESQRDSWFLFKGHIPSLIAFVIFLIAGTAETNRGPFDLAEAESELTAGFHTEYSGIKFAFFFLAEYINMFIVAAMATTVFLGGWMPLHFGQFESFNAVMDFIPPLVWFFVKVLGVIFLIMWFKWTFPRLRVDQILTLEWKYLLPINLVNILLMCLVVLTKFHL
jgi:NADH-quinone oxidoreductase subunit H